MSTTPHSTLLNTPGTYRTKVTLISVILTGDRPVIFTRLTQGEDKHVTHAVRLKGDDPIKSAQALRIGLNELRSGFPNKLALLNDKELIVAMKNNVILNDEVEAVIVPQVGKNNLPIKLDNGDYAFNVRLRPIEPMSDTVADSLIEGLLSHANTPTNDDPFKNVA